MASAVIPEQPREGIGTKPRDPSESAGDLDPQFNTAIAQRKANFKPKAKKVTA